MLSVIPDRALHTLAESIESSERFRHLYVDVWLHYNRSKEGPEKTSRLDRSKEYQIF